LTTPKNFVSHGRTVRAELGAAKNGKSCPKKSLDARLARRSVHAQFGTQK